MNSRMRCCSMILMCVQIHKDTTNGLKRSLIVTTLTLLSMTLKPCVVVLPVNPHTQKNGSISRFRFDKRIIVLHR